MNISSVMSLLLQTREVSSLQDLERIFSNSDGAKEVSCLIESISVLFGIKIHQALISGICFLQLELIDIILFIYC